MSTWEANDDISASGCALFVDSKPDGLRGEPPEIRVDAPCLTAGGGVEAVV